MATPDSAAAKLKFHWLNGNIPQPPGQVRERCSRREALDSSSRISSGIAVDVPAAMSVQMEATICQWLQSLREDARRRYFVAATSYRRWMFAIYSGLPLLGLPTILLLVLLFNGFGEEAGWCGFALEPLQRRFGPVGGTLILAGLWAGWHTPTFFVVETYRTMTVPVIIGGFGLGICAGAIVLSRIAQRTNGSVLAAALWHALYNMTSATAASRGVIAAVTTTCVMAWAAVLLIAEARRRTRGSVLLVEHA